ncbi:aminotransferase-like domain-containing protein [Methanoplanus limicola]|uniref:Putative transcriptional regulator, GntR family n=1 Tax=Methanoplanus limicola DSM 2279 TaxID=937775 RepID=H1YXJ8_9EURY|nr:PLP-dependent aminotransferase family protein [Methanoplanus limicola]EHQ34967.1 putative transcriptional regulator, GntR family [Methanoplanus limicola DSM 2279]
MNYQFAARMSNMPESFIERLFSLSSKPGVISFAGGLPSADLLDVEGLKSAAVSVFEDEGSEALQYTTTDGYLPLREYIADRYNKRLGLNAGSDEIRIVNGSQQCLDLVAKIFTDPGDCIGMERPGYLGAIEAFSLYEPEFATVGLSDDGIDTVEFEDLVCKKNPAFFYGIPNFQNPSGRTYSQETRKKIGEILEGSSTVFYEDDAFGELAFDRKPRIPVKAFAGENGIMSGSFSKIIAPGMRIGWIYAPAEIISQFDSAKQAADLHSNFLCQKIMARYLWDNDLDSHIRKITSVYSARCRVMLDIMDDLFMDRLTHTNPEGGMFMLAGLPAGISSLTLFERALAENVAVLPGVPFYAGSGGLDNIRFNFSNADEEMIKTGMERLDAALRSLGV